MTIAPSSGLCALKSVMTGSANHRTSVGYRDQRTPRKHFPTGQVNAPRRRRHSAYTSSTHPVHTRSAHMTGPHLVNLCVARASGLEARAALGLLAHVDMRTPAVRVGAIEGMHSGSVGVLVFIAELARTRKLIEVETLA